MSRPPFVSSIHSSFQPIERLSLFDSNCKLTSNTLYRSLVELLSTAVPGVQQYTGKSTAAVPDSSSIYIPYVHNTHIHYVHILLLCDIE